MSFAMEVIADGSGKFCGNACRYATFLEANHAGSGLTTPAISRRGWEHEKTCNYY
jgi:hypothetical protein